MGPFPNAVGPAQSIDGEGYVIDFKPEQSVNDSIEFTASPVVPEPSTSVMVLTGFGALGWLGRRRLRVILVMTLSRFFSQAAMRGPGESYRAGPAIIRRRDAAS
jgi:hypothetical protein